VNIKALPQSQAVRLSIRGKCCKKFANSVSKWGNA
jgi:hypothetical protein